MNASQANLAKIIPFRKNELLLIDNAGEPFVPMKPVVEGMGLAWQTQHRKLMSGRFSSTITEMVIVAQDGKPREMTCLPLRKLTGWLMSIHPNKVRPSLREGIIAYQNECDDALWAYWNDGMAVRTHDRNAVAVVAELVGVTELAAINGVIYDKAKLVTKDKRISFIHTMHNRLHTRFNVPRVELIPAQQFEAACNFVAAYALEGEWLPKQEQALGVLTLDVYQANSLSCLLHYADWVNHRWHQGISDAVKALNPDFYSHTWEFFRELHQSAKQLEKSPEIAALCKTGNAKRPHECSASVLAV